jgi:hypothetical protein
MDFEKFRRDPEGMVFDYPAAARAISLHLRSFAMRVCPIRT